MRTLWCACVVMALFCSVSVPAEAQEPARMRLVFCCKANNDLYDLLASRGGNWMRLETPLEAIRYAPEGAGVLILAEGYPDEQTAVKEELIDLAAKKKLRVYVEFAYQPAGTFTAPVYQTRGERVVVSSGWFDTALPKSRILTMHACSIAPVDLANPHLLLGRVAGYDTAVFGVPEWESPRSQSAKTFAILAKHPLGEILISSTKLSNFVTGRYAPTEAWRSVWRSILEWLSGSKVLVPAWQQTVTPSFGAQETLPADAEVAAGRRGVQWYVNAKMLVHPSWAGKFKEEGVPKDFLVPAPDADAGVGDGKLGILEGFASRINYDGTQPVRYVLRNDCTSESAMAFAFDGAGYDSARNCETASNLNDFIYQISELARGPRADPKSASYGLVGWSTDPAGIGVYYGDDNARSMLGTLATAALLKTDRWHDGVARCLLANLRTTGSLGFRANAVDESMLQLAGWRHYFNTPTISLAPHYQAYLWACYLWAYAQTNYAPLLERTKTAIKMTMDAYPDQWRWTNGLQQERARMLLPLAWLVRVEDTPEHRGWLKRVADDLIALQDETGAIREEFGMPKLGTIPPPASNEEYGTREAPLIQENGDPACDLLYTTNFAFLGLHEAAAVMREAPYGGAEHKLAQFLCRIQIRSLNHPELDGGWYRGFDFKRWEFWGSDADTGWGAWSIETGWTQGWITTVFALRHMKTSLWEVLVRNQVKQQFDPLATAMMQGASDVPEDEKASHLAVGKTVKLTNAYTPPFSGGGDNALADGRTAKPDHQHPAFQGFLGGDLEAVIDLGTAVPVKTITARFLQSLQADAIWPASVEYAISEDGTTYRVVATLPNDAPATKEGPEIKEFKTDLPEAANVRYVRVHAKNIGTVPEGAPNKGKKAWLLADEVVVQ